MGTFTAQILIGDAHRFHDGIQPTHSMYLSENDRPAWILLRHDPLDPESTERIATWIPSVDHMLEDALVMIAAHVIRAEGVFDAIGRSNIDTQGPVSLLEGAPTGALEAGRSATRATNFEGLKLVITVLEESTIRKQVGALKNYGVSAIVCGPL